MKNLFIDTNIWLSLYHFTNDDLVQFRKLKDFLGSDIQLFITSQVRDEIYRNRESKLKDAFKSFELRALQYPVFSKEYDEYESFNRDYCCIVDRFKKWKRRIDQDIIEERLPADLVIKEIIDSVNIVSCDAYIDSAFIRYRIGNPPGKDNKYGDAINWECLLNVVPMGEDLYFVSNDKDYRSELNEGVFNPFLAREWTKKKNSHIVFYNNLVNFLSEHIKEIELETENNKDKYIRHLAASASFFTTHSVVANLNKYGGWNNDQIEKLCSIAETNDQVSRILTDSDVFSFYYNLLSNHSIDEKDDSAARRMWQWIQDYIDIQTIDY